MNNTKIVREKNSTLLRSVQIGPCAHLASYSGITTALPSRVKRQRREANYFHLVRRLRMTTAKHPLSHMLPWRVQGKLLFCTQSDPELNRSALTLYIPTPNILKVNRAKTYMRCSGCLAVPVLPRSEVHGRKACCNLEGKRP
jgi:hypothetical protein